MKWPFKKHKHYALTGDTSGSILAEFTSDRHGRTTVTILSSTSGLSINNEINLNRLLSSVPKNLMGKVAVSLPLNFFNTMSLSLPAMPDEAVAQALPYHLAKTISRPMKEYLYDWQITSRTVGKINLTIYLFPLAAYNLMRRELATKQLEIAYLDCDLFASFAYLVDRKRLKQSGASLCLLLWPDSVSIGIYENRIITLARSFSLEMPSQQLILEAERKDEPLFDTSDETIELDLHNTGESLDAFNEDHNSILMDFDILNQADDNPAQEDISAPQTKQADVVSDIQPEMRDNAAGTNASGWQEYLDRVNLEVMRTRDYYTSVIKGSPIQDAFLVGEEQCFEALKKMADNSLGLDFQPLLNQEEKITDCRPIYSVVCRGAVTRW